MGKTLKMYELLDKLKPQLLKFRKIVPQDILKLNTKDYKNILGFFQRTID